MNLTTEEKAMFWNQVEVKGFGECWRWKGGLNLGYGNFYLNGKTWRAHRVSYMLSKGKIGKGMSVLHSCDNPACVNPKHLRQGNAYDNALDCVSRGRHVSKTQPEKILRGERVNTAKLTASKVKRIRIFKNKGISTRNLASKFGVSTRTIDSVICRQHWRHVL